MLLRVEPGRSGIKFTSKRGKRAGTHSRSAGDARTGRRSQRPNPLFVACRPHVAVLDGGPSQCQQRLRFFQEQIAPRGPRPGQDEPARKRENARTRARIRGADAAVQSAWSVLLRSPRYQQAARCGRQRVVVPWRSDKRIVRPRWLREAKPPPFCLRGARQQVVADPVFCFRSRLMPPGGRGHRRG